MPFGLGVLGLLGWRRKRQVANKVEFCLALRRTKDPDRVEFYPTNQSTLSN
jgi:hypothetical protein